MSEPSSQGTGRENPPEQEPTSWIGIATQVVNRLLFWLDRRYRFPTIILVIVLVVTIALAVFIPLQPNESSTERFAVSVIMTLVEVGLYILYYLLSGRIGTGQRTAEDDKPSKLKFTNRVNEINTIMGASQSATPMYQAIDAPAGYGKSELLKELQKRFEKLDWKCAQVVVKPGQAFDVITNGIALQMNFKSNAGLPAAIKAWGDKSLSRHNGLVLLVDFDQNTLYDALLNELGALISQIFESLRTLKAFQNKEFRVIVAGRGISQKTDSLSGPSAKPSVPFKSLTLSPFRFEDVHTAARNFLPGETEDSISQLAAHTIYFTGGHPQCMYRMLELYQKTGGDPDRFISQNDQQIWGIVAPIAEDVRNSIPDSLRSCFDTLSIFRRFEHHMLDELKTQELLQFTSRAHFIQNLTQTKLVCWQDGFYRDDITRRLIAIRFERHDKFRYDEICGKSPAIYLELLASKTPNTGRPFPYPHLCVIECIFQALRAGYLHCIAEADRASLREEFFSPQGILAKFLKELPTDGSYWDDFLTTLEHPENWEFRFYVNYFLRDGVYDSQPFQRLLREANKVRMAMGQGQTSQEEGA